MTDATGIAGDEGLGALYDSAPLYRGIVENSPDLIYIVRDHTIVYVNPAGVRLLRARSADAIVGRGPSEFIHPDFLEQTRRRAERLREGLSVNPLVHNRLVAVDGTTIDVEVYAVPFVLDGRVHAQVICRDITDRLALEASLGQAQRLEALGRLTGGIAHDFNNLLTVILGSADMLADRVAGDSAGRDAAGLIIDAATRASVLTRRLLAFARRQPLVVEAVDLAGLTDGLSTLLRPSLGEQILFDVEIGADVNRVQTDASQLESALLNICLNAAAAMPQGGRLRIKASGGARLPDAPPGAQAPGDYVAIAVSDTGMGIRPDDLSRVFEPYFTTRASAGGTGLGLAIVHGFVKQSHGEVRIESEVGRGTTVTLYLPSAAA